MRSLKATIVLQITLSFAFWMAAVSCVCADDTELSRKTLKAISVLQVVAEDLGTDIDPRGTLKSQIQADVETRLRLAGIGLTSEAEISPKSAWLMVHANVIRSGQFGYVYHVDFRLAQPVRLVRDSSFFMATTWSRDFMGNAGSLDSLRKIINDHVFVFVAAYRSVNP
jgi:hypothetical protein